MSKIGLYVKFIALPGQRDLLVEQLLGAAKLVEDAPGCELWIVNTSPAQADAVWVTEVWSSQADYDASLSNESAKAAIQRVIPLLTGPPERIETIPVGGKGLAMA